MLIIAMIKKIIPEEKTHWNCLVAIDKKQKIAVLANIDVKSLIWVFLPEPSNKTIPSEFAESSGRKSNEWLW